MKNLMKIVLFGIGFCILYLGIADLMMMKDNGNTVTVNYLDNQSYYAEKWDGFYQKERESLDILFMGSSVVHCGVDNNLLWNEYGITSYNLSADQCKLGMTYYFLKEAYKYQKPQVVFVEVGMGNYKDGDEISAESAHYNLDFMRMGAAKIQAVRELNIENKSEMLNPLELYHSRWKELTENDFRYVVADKQNPLNGHLIYMMNNEKNGPEVYDVESKELSEIGYSEIEGWLDKIISLCEENNTKCILFKTPRSETSIEKEQYFKAIEQYVSRKKLDYWNFLDQYEDMNLDFKTDFVDGGHMNLSGSQKFTLYLGEKISKELEIDDKRGVDKYSQWDEDYLYQKELIEQYISDQEEK